ncbi:hypothetical protein CBA19CS11_35585 [Caballeronia novacaledonica]|uniref:hypothetical protein n=1 Tax=Caballeronia novacaledonica TaxID=1544861 RepID=UPI001EE25D73|nr:hypothetical protein [Caballeronia novacaledonica]GJH14277.1 hypothetical protein CBA19CS11_35585 [Caballeronia novacaledonica]
MVYQATLSRERDDGEAKITRFLTNAGFSKAQFGDGLEKQELVFQPLETNHYRLISGCGWMPLDKQTTVSALVRSHPYAAATFVALCMIAFMLHVLNEKAKSELEVIYPMSVAYFGALFGSSYYHACVLISGRSDSVGMPEQPTICSTCQSFASNARAAPHTGARDFWLPALLERMGRPHLLAEKGLGARIR